MLYTTACMSPLKHALEHPFQQITFFHIRYAKGKALNPVKILKHWFICEQALYSYFANVCPKEDK
jgi:hypothetical protein